MDMATAIFYLEELEKYVKEHQEILVKMEKEVKNEGRDLCTIIAYMNGAKGNAIQMILEKIQHMKANAEKRLATDLENLEKEQGAENE